MLMGNINVHFPKKLLYGKGKIFDCVQGDTEQAFYYSSNLQAQ